MPENPELSSIAQRIMRDRDFLMSGRPTQREVLGSRDPDFKSLSPEIQDQVINNFISSKSEDALGYGDRFKLSFTGSAEDTMRVLGEKFGAGNVINTKRGIAFRRNPEDRFGFIDEPGWTFGDIADIVGESLPTIGATVGSVLGAPGGPAGMGVGAGIGGAGGEAWRQLGARAFGMEAPETSGEAALDIGTTGVVEGALDVATGGLMKFAGGSLGFARRNVTEQAQRFMEFLKNSGLEDVGPTIAQATIKPLHQFFENIMEGGIFGGPLLKLKERTKIAVADLSRGISQKFAKFVNLPPEQLKALGITAPPPDLSIQSLLLVLNDTIRHDKTTATAIREGILNRIGRTKLIPGKTFDDIKILIGDNNFNKIIVDRNITPRPVGAAPPPRVKTQQETIIKTTPRRGVQRTTREMEEEAARGSRTVRQVSETEGQVTTKTLREEVLAAIREKEVQKMGPIELKDAVTIRTSIMGLIRKAETGGAETGLDLYDLKKALGVIDEAILAKIPAEDLVEWNLQNKIYKKMFKKDAIRDLILATANNPQGPELFSKLTLKEITDIKNLLGASDPGFQVLQVAATGSVIDRALSKPVLMTPAGEAVPEVLGHTLRERVLGKGEIIGALTPQKVEVLLGREGLQDFKQILDAFDVLQAGKEGMGKVWISLAQAGAAGTVMGGGLLTGVTGPAAIAAGVIIIGPYALARLVAHGPSRRLMLEGLSAQRRGQGAKAMSIAARLARLDRVLIERIKRVTDERLNQPALPELSVPPAGMGAMAPGVTPLQ